MVHDNGIGDRSFVMGDQANASEKSVSLNTSPLQIESSLALSSPLASDSSIGLASSQVMRFAPETTSLQALVIEDRSTKISDKTASTQNSEVKPVTAGSLDPSKSMLELASAGLLIDKTKDTSKATDNGAPSTDRPVERVSAQTKEVSVLSQNADRTFVMAPASSQGEIKPDVLIKRDGTVEMLKAPEKTSSGQAAPLVIQLEGTTDASEAQLKAAREIETWLGQRKELLTKQEQEKTAMEAAAQEQRLREADEASAQRAHNAAEMFKRNGSMSREEADDYFPPASDNGAEPSQQFQPEKPEQQKSYQYLKESIAALSGANKEHPYETLRRTPENGFGVGRYGLTADLFMSWLSSLEDFNEVLGTPPDFSKLGKLMEQLAKKGKVPKDFAAKFKDQQFCKEFGQFLDTMKEGKGTLNASDIQKFFPKEMQEAVMKGVLDDAAAKKLPAEQVALAMHLGKPLGQLSDADKNDPKNKEFMSASLKVMGLAAARDQAGKGDRIDWQQSNDPASPLAFRIARAAEKNALNNNTVGWCYREVADTLDNFGVHLYGNSAYMAAPQLAQNKNFKEVSADNLKPGTVLVFGKSEGHPHGHITVYLGNGREASDHVQKLVNFKAYGGVRAFEPV